MGKVQVAGQRNIQLGGDNLDHNLVLAIATNFNKTSNLDEDINNDLNAMSIIKNECEKVKIDLTSNEKSEVKIDHLFGGLSYTTTINRTYFNNLNRQFFDNCIDFMHNIIVTGGIQIQHVD